VGNHWFQTYHKYYCEQLRIEQFTYNPYLLYMNSNGFAVTVLQTDNTLLLADKKLTEREEMKFCEVGFLAKEREELTTANSIKFDGGYIKR
jgi:hypothetical protein